VGRPKLTTEELQLRGTYRADRHAPKLAVPLPADVEEARLLDEARKRVRGKAALGFFDRQRSAYTGWSAREAELLVQAAALVQTIEDADAAVRRDGMIVTGAKGGLVRHPALIVAGAARTELRHTLRALNLED
jgi:hypothetical protein